jgi:hypothetical protein
MATPQDEADLIPWAERVSAGAIRRRADLRAAPGMEVQLCPEDAMAFDWWAADEERTRMALGGEMPMAEARVLIGAVEAMMQRVPLLPDQDPTDPAVIGHRRAQALLLMCSGGRVPVPHVVLHASVEALERGSEGAELSGGGIVGPLAAQRMACSGRLSAVLTDATGDVLARAKSRRDPPGWMLTELKRRDRCCTFPSCGAVRFTHAHHLAWASRGGPTEMKNLVLVCFFHHKLVHEHRWSLARDPATGEVRWYRPDGRRYRAGPEPAGPDPPGPHP